MNITTDSDDSAFLFNPKLFKRKALNNTSKVKKLRKSDDDVDKDSEDLTGVETKEEEEITGGSMKQNISIREERSKIDSEENNYKAERVAPGCSALGDVKDSKLENEGIQDLKLKDTSDSYSCPLCLKYVTSETALISHMKLCGKRYNMTCKELLEALELHKQHLKKRTSLKLFPQIRKTKKVPVEDTDGSTCDLALGLALSKSLTEINGNGKEDKSSVINSKTTLESFGFTFKGTGKKKSKNWKHHRFVLRERTRDEREKILTEKAAVILLSQDHQLELSDGGKDFENLEFPNDGFSKVSHLWKLAENEDNADWYVRDIEDFILNENLTEKHGTEGKDCGNEKEKEKEEEEGKGKEEGEEKENIDKEIKELNLPRAAIFQQWKKLINNKNMSDLTVRANSSIFYLHSLVLYARFPKLLDMDLEKVFHQFDTHTINSFLQYLYCGGLDGLPRSQVDNLLLLASSVNFEELVEIMNALKGNLIDGEDPRRSNDENNMKTNSSDNDDVADVSIGTSNAKNPSEEGGEAREGDEGIVGESYGEFWPSLGDEIPEEDGPLFEIERIKEGKSSNPRSRTGDGDTERDLFEEMENLNEICINEETKSSEGAEESERDCILISSDSSKSDDERKDEEAEAGEGPAVDCEIPYFDPYEHFNSEIPMEDYPLSNDAEEPRTPEPAPKDVSPSPVIRNSPIGFAGAIEELSGNSPIGDPPEFCSTPVGKSLARASVLHEDPGRNKCGKGRQRRTPCTRRKRSLANRNLAKSSIKKGRTRKGNNPEEEDPKALRESLSKSLLNDFDETVRFTSEETIREDETEKVEVTPSLGRGDYTDDVSPLPDYSMMNPSTIKKHLAKYGLKKSLSKNKAKKILRYIYEELHPMIDTRNGKIIKRAMSEKKKPGKAIKGKKRNSETRNKGKQFRLQMENETTIKDVSYRDNRTDSSGRAEGSSMEESDSFTEEPLTGNRLDFDGLSEAVYDFIRSDSEIRTKVLMYEPIWLENFRNQLYEKYKKKFKLTDLQDCLDAQCITFRSEKQRATNMRRVKKSKKLTQGR